MKRNYAFLIACAISFQLIAQEGDPTPEVPEVPEVPEIEEAPEAPDYADTVNVINKVEVIETPENTKVTLGENELLIVEESGDTVRVVLGSKGIKIVEGPDGTEIKVMDMDDYPRSTHKKKKKKRFRPHYAGFEVGLANYVTPEFSMVLPPEDAFMDLNSGRSWNWNINPVDIGFGFGTDKIGLGTGLGFEFLYFNFDGQNGIMKDEITRNIVEYVPTYASGIYKSKMHMAYMNVPLLLEFQIPTHRKRVYVGVGVTGGLKLWSSTKIKYRMSGEKSKEKTRGDYNLSPLRWGLTARAGYGSFGLYANYAMTSLFKPTMGPELYPFTVGLAFSW